MNPRTTRWILDLVLVTLLVIGAYRVYRWSPGAVQDCDSLYSMAAGEMLISQGTLRLDTALPNDLTTLPCYSPPLGKPYQLVELPPSGERPGGFYYGYPLGSVLLSLPLIEHYSVSRGITCFNGAGRFFPDGERLLQKKLAAIVAAIGVGIFYLIARTVLSSGYSVLVALIFALGSMTWSTLSRGMWSHTWLAVELGLAIWILGLLAQRRSNPLDQPSKLTEAIAGISLGMLLFAIYITRPQAMVSIAAIGAYLGLMERRVLIWTIGAAMIAAGTGAGLSEWVFGTPIPPSVYNPSDIDGQDVPQRFWNILFAPSRGLLIFCPFLAVIAYLLIAYRNTLGSSAALLLPAGLAIGAHTAILSAYNGWYGGSCYGPRYYSDVLPWFVLVTAVAINGMVRKPTTGFPWRKSIEALVLAILVGWAVFVHARGAVSRQAWDWNLRALQMDVREAVVDWRYPQFLCGLTFKVAPDGKILESE